MSELSLNCGELIYNFRNTLLSNLQKSMGKRTSDRLFDIIRLDSKELFVVKSKKDFESFEKFGLAKIPNHFPTELPFAKYIIEACFIIEENLLKWIEMLSGNSDENLVSIFETCVSGFLQSIITHSESSKTLQIFCYCASSALNF